MHAAIAQRNHRDDRRCEAFEVAAPPEDVEWVHDGDENLLWVGEGLGKALCCKWKR